MNAPAGADVADRQVSLGSAFVAAIAVLALPILHLANRLSTRRTLAVVAWLGRRRVQQFSCRPWRVARAVNAVARLFGLQRTTCLARSQLTWLILSLCGRRPVIRVGAGAGFGAGTFAHAWVELNDMPVGESADVAIRHAPFDRPLLGPAT